MNTPEVTALSAAEMQGYMLDYGNGEQDLTSNFHARLLATIAERDGPVRELEAQAQKWFQECLRLEGAALKSTVVSGDDREELVNIIAERTSDGRANAGIVADALLAAGFRRPQESLQRDTYIYVNKCDDVTSRFDIYKSPRQEGLVFATAYTEDEAKMICAAMSTSPAGFRRPQESSEAEQTPDAWDSAIQEYGPSASPAEPVKVAGREALIEWFQKECPSITCGYRGTSERAADSLLASGILTGRKFSCSKIRAIVRRKVTSAEEADDITDTLLYPTADIWDE